MIVQKGRAWSCLAWKQDWAPLLQCLRKTKENDCTSKKAPPCFKGNRLPQKSNKVNHSLNSTKSNKNSSKLSPRNTITIMNTWSKILRNKFFKNSWEDGQMRRRQENKREIVVKVERQWLGLCGKMGKPIDHTRPCPKHKRTHVPKLRQLDAGKG